MKKPILYIAFTIIGIIVHLQLSAQCMDNYTFSAYPPPNGGSYNSGETVTFCFQTDWTYDILNPEFLMGIEVILGPGWDQTSIVPTALPNNCIEFPDNTTSCNGSGSWSWVNSFNNPQTGAGMGMGFLFEDSNIDPTNYFGDNCAITNNSCADDPCFSFCFTVSVLPFASCSDGDDLTVAVNPLSDGEIGTDDDMNCAGDPNPSIAATVSCCNVSAGSDNCVTYCSDSSIGLLNLNDMIIGENLGGDWFYGGVNLGSNFFNPATDPAGTYTYVVTGIGGCTDESTLEITINPFPDAGPPVFELEACSDFPVLNIINFFTPPPTDFTGSWEDPSGNPWDGTYDADVDPDGIYLYITATNGICPGDTVFVTLTSVDYLDPGMDNILSVCSGQDPLNLFDFLLGSPANVGVWTDPNNNTLPGGHLGVLDPATAIPGSYTYTVATGTLGQCSASSEIVVSISNQLDAGINTTTVECPSGNTFDLNAYLDGSPDPGGTWTEQISGITIPGGIINPFDYPANNPIEFEYTIGSGACEDSSTLTLTFTESADAGMTSNGQNSLSLCGPSLVDFDFEFNNGTGPYSIIVTDQNGIEIINENGIAGPSYNSSVLVSTSSSFSFTFFEDTGNPCQGFINGNNTIDVVVNSPPNGNLSVSDDICLGNSVNVDLNLSGSGPFTAKIEIGTGGPIETFTSLGPVESIPITPPGPSGPTTITLVEVIDANLPACTTAVASAGTIDIFDPPTINLLDADSLCAGEQGQIELNINGQWTNYSIWLNENGNLFQFTNVADGDVIDVPSPATLTYCVDSISPMNIGNCVSPVLDCVEIYVSDNPEIVDIEVICNPIEEEGILNFTIIDSDSDDFLVNGINGSISGNNFESIVYQNGENFNIQVEDEFGCLSEIESEMINCACVPSFPGTMITTDTITTCDNLSIDVLGLFANDSIIQSDDLFEFVLHDSPGNSLGTIYDASSLPVFLYNSSLVYGQVYYVSPIAGLNDNGSINLLDPCLAVGEGLPIIFYPQPTANINSTSTTICVGQSVDIEIELEGGGPWTFVLEDGSGPVTGSPFTVNSSPFIYSTNNPGIYSITSVTNANCNGVIIQDQIEIVQSDLPTVQINPIGIFCENDQNQLELIFTGNGPWIIEYSLNGNPQTALEFDDPVSILDLNAEGDYLITQISDQSCISYLNEAIEIEFLENPTGSISGGGSFCLGDSALFLLEFNGGNPDYTFEISDGMNTLGPFSTSSGIYSFYASDPGNFQLISLNDEFCNGSFSGIASNEIIELPQVDMVLSSNQICEGDALFIDFNFNQNDNFEFDLIGLSDTLTINASNGDQISVSPADNTQFEILNIQNLSTGCVNDIGDSELLTILPIPDAIAGADVLICPGDTAQLGSNPIPGATYFWENLAGLSDPFSANPSVSLENFSEDNIDIEYVMVVDLDGCQNTDTVLVNVYEPPSVYYYFNPNPVLLTDPVVNLINQSDNNLDFIWDIESLGILTEVNPTVQFSNLEPDNYRVCLYGTDNNGCTSSYCSFIEVSGDPILYIPNSFTPDGDGVNDYFGPVLANSDADEYEFSIFNRWGERIFISYSPKNQWNGSASNEDYYVSSDTYIWSLQFKNPFSPEILQFKGHVTVVR